MLLQVCNVVSEFQVEASNFELHLFAEFWEFVDFVNFGKVAVQEVGVESLEFLYVEFSR